MPALDVPTEYVRLGLRFDRVVEPGGLVLLAWTLGSTNLDSYFRVAEPADPAE